MATISPPLGLPQWWRTMPSGDAECTVIYRRLADAVVIAHLLIALFFLFGAPLTLWSSWVFAAHLPLMLWVYTALLFDWTCPLTPLENWLRNLAGSQGYRESFVEHYLVPLVVPDNQQNSRETAVIIAAVTGLMNAAIYAIVVVQLLDD